MASATPRERGRVLRAPGGISSESRQPFRGRWRPRNANGGGAKGAEDKVFQFNGAGELTVSGFQVEDFGKLVRSCGNCSTMYERDIVVKDVDVTAPGKSLVGINSDYGDTATLSSIRIHGDSGKKIEPCVRYEGNDDGDEPEEVGSGPDGEFCLYSESDISYE